MEAIVLPLTYFGNIAYFHLLYTSEKLWIDDREVYLKQSFRNRTQILAANAKLDLTVPVNSSKGYEIRIDKVRINYDDPWQVKHWRSIVSAYRSAPFFDEYEEDIKHLIFSKHDSLVDLNIEITDKLMELLGKKLDLHFKSKEEIPEFSHSMLGYFKPSKMPTSHSELKAYMQVFNYKFGFVPNLSILDLLFNEGPYALSYLQSAKSS